MIQNNSIQEVRDRADIVEVVGHFISLKRRGANYLANCPFHNERTPSFNVNPARGIYKCFGCGKAGDAVSFVQEYEKFSFVEAIRWLANFYHITLEESEQTQESKDNKKIEESLRILFEFAAKYFEDKLWHHEEGQLIGLSYFRERGFTTPVMQKFRLGYALDDWNAFQEHAIAQGYSREMLVKSSIVSEKNDKIYDTYRGRVIFPIQSNTGKVVGFGARIIKSNDKAPKYLNSSENEVYNKSKILYGLYQSKNAIAQRDECILVEGYTDVISLHQHGVENVVSSSGTALTEGQLKLIKNLTRNLTILYDADNAGIKAAIRGIELALSNSFNVRLALLPQGEDPDSFVQKQGEEGFYNYLQNQKLDPIDFQILLKKDQLHDPTQKSALVNDLAKTISLIDKAEDFVLQQEYIRKVASKLDTDEQGMITLVNKYISNHLTDKYKQQEREKNNLTNNSNAISTNDAITHQEEINLSEVPRQSGIDISTPASKLEEAVLKILLRYGARPYDDDGCVIDYFCNAYDPSIFQDAHHALFLSEIIKVWYDKGEDAAFQRHFIQHPDQDIQSRAINMIMQDTTPNPKWESEAGIVLKNLDENYLEEVHSTLAYFELSIIQRYIKENLEELKNPALDPKDIAILMNTHKELKAHEKSLLNLVVKPAY